MESAYYHRAKADQFRRFVERSKAKRKKESHLFFSKDKKSAMKRVKTLAKYDPYYKKKVPVLAKKQIPHSRGWKTWKLVKVV